MKPDSEVSEHFNGPESSGLKYKEVFMALKLRQ